MKVAVLTQYFPTSSQPWAGHSAYQTLRRLSSRCDLHVFYPQAVYPRLLTPKTAAVGVGLDPSWNPPDVRATYIPYPVLPLISRPLNGFAMARKLMPAIKEFAPDILLNYVIYPDGYAAVRIGRALKVPVVLTAIGSDLNRMPDRLVASLTRAALRQADAVTTVSHDLAKTAIRLGARQNTTIAILNGCDTSIFKPCSLPDERIALRVEPDCELVLYVGRLDLRKGLAELIEATSRLSKHRPRLRTYLVGDGPDGPALRTQIRLLGMEDIIRMIPPCQTADVARWMGAASLVTLPSYMEGCPNVLLEALAAGRPMVATNVGGIPELMDDQSGRLVPSRDIVALTTGIDEVLSETWDSNEIARCHNRSWDDVADDLFRVLEGSVMGGSSGG
jgi:teichuronic acid biosynthesis glycosyltransferase TuaC